jgi:hypothetical protein
MGKGNTADLRERREAMRERERETDRRVGDLQWSVLALLVGARSVGSERERGSRSAEREN